mgnify:CR=1 FL=1
MTAVAVLSLSRSLSTPRLQGGLARDLQFSVGSEPRGASGKHSHDTHDMYQW